MEKLSVGIAGLGFGKEFVYLYQNHPGVDKVAIHSRTPATLKAVGDQFGIPEELRFLNYDDMVACPALSAIHVVTPPATHADYVLRAMKAGKHAACTVPMGMTVQELKDICRVKRETGLNYMMMETALYTREYLLAKAMHSRGEFGKLQFLRGSHMQDMGLEGWAEYWLGLPPMLYGTHAISPLLDIIGGTPEYVICHGSGRVQPQLAEKYGCPFAVETTTIKFRNSDVVAEATRSLYDTVRQYRESFDFYGSKTAFEWEQLAEEGHIIYDGGELAHRVTAPDVTDTLPEALHQYTRRETIVDPNQPSFIQGAGHGGSHPHLVHEFVTSILEKREPSVGAVYAAYITGTGVCSHESAMQNAAKIEIPHFEDC